MSFSICFFPHLHQSVCVLLLRDREEAVPALLRGLRHDVHEGPAAAVGHSGQATSNHLNNCTEEKKFKQIE